MPNFEKFRKDKATFTFPVILAGYGATQDVVTACPLGKAGLITGFRYVTDVLSSTAAAVAFNLEIGSTNLTGGAIALTHLTATPDGKVVESSAITANNGFNAGDTFSLEAVVTTAFTEGSGSFQVDVEYTN